MSKYLRRLGLLFALVALCAIGISSGAAAHKSKAAKSDSGTFYVGYTHSEGSQLVLSGDGKSKLFGRVAVFFLSTASSPMPGTVHVAVKPVIMYTKKGTLTGTAEADQTTNPDGSGTISNGSFKLTKGTESLKGHTEKGTFDGTYDNSTGIYTLDYQGKFK